MRDIKRKRQLNLIKYLYILLAVEIIVISILNAYIAYFGKEPVSRYAVTSMVFAYDGATHGLTPTKETFSVKDIKDTEIIEEALKHLNLQDKYDAATVASCLVVTGSYPSDILDRVDGYNSVLDSGSATVNTSSKYIPTNYSLALYDEFDKKINKKVLESIVNEIALVYKEHFISTYTYKVDHSTVIDVLGTNNSDYSVEVDKLSTRISFLKSYASKMYNLDQTFAVNGTSFRDLANRCDVLNIQSVSTIDEYISRMGITKNLAMAVVNYYYSINSLNNQRKYIVSEIAEVEKIKDNYKLDNNMYIASNTGSDLYASKTEATYASLVNKVNELTEQVNSIDKNISFYQARIEDYENTYATAGVIENVNNELADIANTITSIENDFDTLLSAYNAKIIPESSIILSNDVKTVEKKLFSFGFIKRVIIASIPLVLVFAVVLCLRMFIYEIKKSR